VILGQEIIHTFAMFISKNMDNQNLSDNPFNNLIAFLLTGGQAG
jgi:hypothetical protein